MLRRARESQLEAKFKVLWCVCWSFSGFSVNGSDVSAEIVDSDSLPGFKCPSGKVVHCTVEYPNKVLGEVLFKEVERLTGIPSDLQMLIVL